MRISDWSSDVCSSDLVMVRLSGNFDDYIGPISGGAEVYRQVMRTNPVLFPAFYEPDEAHSHVRHILFGNYGTDASYLNPYANLVRGYKESSNSRIDAQFELKQDFNFLVKGLSGRALFNKIGRASCRERVC